MLHVFVFIVRSTHLAVRFNASFAAIDSRTAKTLPLITVEVASTIQGWSSVQSQIPNLPYIGPNFTGNGTVINIVCELDSVKLHAVRMKFIYSLFSVSQEDRCYRPRLIRLDFSGRSNATRAFTVIIAILMWIPFLFQIHRTRSLSSCNRWCIS